MPDSVRVAISADFFGAYSKIPAAQQQKVSRFITNFQKNPRSTGINYEKINVARDPNMHSVRIDQAYRGIILKPEKGDVYILLWVDHHDAAYDWARKNRCRINAETGSIQVFEVTEPEAASEEALPEINPSFSAFTELKDKELMRLGVPEELIGLVRGVSNEADLDRIEHRLPVEAYEALFLYLAGSRFDEIVNEREFPAGESIDPENFSKALDSLSTQSCFFVVEDELELAGMLNAPLEKWRVFLHPSQRRLVEGEKNGACRVLGGAGTGKTVVAMHRAKWLAQHAAQGHQKILFTTFTRNLALDIETNLKAICSPEQMGRIEVVNLDRWVSNYLRKKRYEFKILYDSDSDAYWRRALDLKPTQPELPNSFYRDEWYRVIQPQSVETLEQYKRASRLGRGTRLSRSDRVHVWPVFEEFRNLVTLDQCKEVNDAYRDATALLAQEGRFPYGSVVVDEAQDMSMQAFRLIRHLVPEGPNDLFIVGDGHQRIYGRNKVILSQCGIQVRGRSRKLHLNYRTTEEIRRWAVNLLEGCTVDDLDGGSDNNDRFKSLTHGEAPILLHFDQIEQQLEHIRDYLRQRIADQFPLESICIVARVKSELETIQNYLNQTAIPAILIDRDQSDLAHEPAVKLATMHRVKGLEFEEVILASINEGLVPLSKALESKGDAVERKLADQEERALLYVAVTRAKKKAFVFSYGRCSSYLAENAAR